ncbi:tetratricopeptide repeat protein [Candidatus Poribacteria bacterium]|nr:tetratricopeptide repeat protein [Candidatus Poribacteria bacterium]
MANTKMIFFLAIFISIIMANFITKLVAQDSEENKTPLQEFVDMAQELVKQDKIVEAIEIYERIVIATPEDTESRTQLTKLYTRTNQHEKAAQTYSELLETDPNNIEYQDEYVKSLQAVGKVDEALEIAQSYIQTYPEVGMHYVRLAKLYDAEGDEAAAIDTYKKAITFGYNDKNTFLRLAEHYFVNEDMDAAEIALKNAISATTSEWDRERIERQLVNLYRYQGNLEEMFQKTEDEGALTFEMQKQRAQHFRNIGELQKAVKVYKKALEMGNLYQKNEIISNLFNVYSKQDRLDLVLEYFETETSKEIESILRSTIYSSKGITVRFDGDSIRKDLINAYKNQGQLDVLRTHFESKFENNAANPAVIELLAEIYWDTNDYQKTAQAYHLLSKTEPMDRRNIRSFYLAAAAFHRNNQPDMVKTVLNQVDIALASVKQTQDPSFLGALATICLNNEMYDRAIILAENAVTQAENADNNWELKYLYEILAKNYITSKRYEDAFNIYQKMAKNADDRYARERAESEMNKAAKAGNLYEKWIIQHLKLGEETPNDTKHILKLAECYEATDKIKEAVTQYERLTTLEPEITQWYKKIGDLYQKLPQQLPKSIDAYEKAIELDKSSYKLYDLLAKSYIKNAQPLQAEETYRRALDATLIQNEYDSAINSIIRLYPNEGQEDKHIALLEEIRQKFQKMDNSAVLHELLGDLYNKTGNSEKAELNYAKWLKIRKNEVNSSQNVNDLRSFSNTLLDKGLYPETALLFAKRSLFNYPRSSYIYHTTLGRACIANGLYDEALTHFKHALTLISNEHYLDRFWQEVVEANKNANDKERFIQLLNELLKSITLDSFNVSANTHRIIAESYAENGMPEEAEKYLLKTGFVPETAWITLGPFDNKDNVGPYISYIPEESTQIDTTAKFYGKDKLIRWQNLRTTM